MCRLTFLDECDAALSHASPKSWLFYLPAYMKRALELHDAGPFTSWLPGSVIFHLTYDRKDPQQISYLLERFTQLTPEQERAVVAFLSYYSFQGRERNRYAEDAKAALDNYWALASGKRPHEIELAD